MTSGIRLGDHYVLKPPHVFEPIQKQAIQQGELPAEGRIHPHQMVDLVGMLVKEPLDAEFGEEMEVRSVEDPGIFHREVFPEGEALELVDVADVRDRGHQDAVGGEDRAHGVKRELGTGEMLQDVVKADRVEGFSGELAEDLKGVADEDSVEPGRGEARGLRFELDPPNFGAPLGLERRAEGPAPASDVENFAGALWNPRPHLRPIRIPIPVIHQSLDARKVSPWFTSPVVKPFLNQRARCSEVPWVKASGTT